MRAKLAVVLFVFVGCGDEEVSSTPTCGDGRVGSGEHCDDGNTASNDGCNAACTVEPGFACAAGAPSTCMPICGDGQLVGGEACDDGDLDSSDGCDAACRIETGWDCVDAPSRCCPRICGDGVALGCDGRTVETCTATDVCIDGACVFDACHAAASEESSVGCDFWAYRPEAIEDALGSCYAAYVVNASAAPAHLAVERGGLGFSDLGFIRIPSGQGPALSYSNYEPTAGLPAGQMAVLFLAHDTGASGAFATNCPVPPAIDAPGLAAVGLDVAFHIESDQPVTAVSVWPYGAGVVPSATLLLPTHVWGTNYLVVTPFDESPYGELAVDLLAREDGTEITLLPLVAVVGGSGVPASAASTPVSITLDAGDLMHVAQDADLTGSAVASSLPIAVSGSSDCINIPLATGACDSAHQQLLPTRALGHRYVGVRYPDRPGLSDEQPPWRLVGAVDGTLLTWQPTAPAGAPSSLDAGQSVTFVATWPFVVASQDAEHPFVLAQHMTGGDYHGAGDPEWVNAVPVGQYLNHYIFPTAPTFPDTHLVVVRQPVTASTFAPVELDCAGVITGWAAVGEYEYAYVPLSTDFNGAGTCNTGVREMSSDGPFTVMVWGWGTQSTVPATGWTSYSYPAGVGARALNAVELPVD